MSFGFSVGDFITILERANKVRTDFVGAPGQFKALSDEVRNLAIVVNDVNIDLTNTSLSAVQQQELQEIAVNSSNVLAEIENVIEQYSAIAKSNTAKRAWKRLRWEPDVARDLRNRLCSNVGLLNAINGRITRDSVMELLNHQRTEKYQNCLHWLSSAVYAAQQSDFIGRRAPGTGEWLLKSPNFETWINSPRQTLLCQGIPGAGKTIMASVIIDDLQARFGNDVSIGIAYIYCSFELRDSYTQKPEGLLASVLRQLTQSLDRVPEIILKLYDTHTAKGTRPTLRQLSQVLGSLISSLSRVFIIIDALDECVFLSALKFLDELFGIQKSHHLNILATSRSVPEIVNQFEDALIQDIQAEKSDLMEFLRANMSQLPAFVSRNKQLQNEIISHITDAAGGMFLLAKLYLDSLAEKWSTRAIRRELNELKTGSQTYDRMYDKAMQRIEDQVLGSRDLALAVLSWVTFAQRPLTTGELLHALAVELDAPKLYEDNLPDLDDIMSVCAGLVTVLADFSGNTIRIIHFTARDYLERNAPRYFANSHYVIASTCIKYLSFDTFQFGACLTEADFESRVNQNPLFLYAANNWGHHARAQPTSKELLLKFLSQTEKISASVQGLFAVNDFSVLERSSALVGSSSSEQHFPQIPTGFTGLHLAAYFGLDFVVASMIENNNIAHETDSTNRTPLVWSVYTGQLGVVKLLYEHCDNPELRDWEGQAAIFSAAYVGRVDIIGFLLDCGVNPNCRDSQGQVPLSWAAYRGHADVVRLLIERGAVPDERDMYGKTPLSWAAAYGWMDIVLFLLAQSVDIDSQDELGRTPISCAAENGHANVVRVFLTKGAQSDLKDTSGYTPLWWASYYDNRFIMELLQGSPLHVDKIDIPHEGRLRCP